MATKTHIKLVAERRTILGKQVRALRRQGILPANIFGHGAPTPVQIDARTFERLRETHQTAGIIDISVAGGRPETVMVRHIDHKPSTGKIQHIDFFRVRMDEILTVRLPLRLEGESPAAKMTKGMVLLLTEAIDVEALPDNLPESLAIDASKLTGLDTILHAGDITLPAGVTLRTNADEPVAKVQPPRGGEEAAEPAAPSIAAATPAAPDAGAV